MLQSMNNPKDYLSTGIILTSYSLVGFVFIVFRAENQIVGEDVGREGDDSDSEAGEEASEHYASLEDCILTPGVPLCPRVSKKREIGHRRLKW